MGEEESGSDGQTTPLIFLLRTSDSGSFDRCPHHSIWFEISNSFSHECFDARPARRLVFGLACGLRGSAGFVLHRPTRFLPALLARFAELGIAHVPVALGGAAIVPPPRDPRGPDTLAFLQYTSGSTRSPHGVMVTHGNLLDNLAMMQQRLGTSAGTCHVSWVPLYHDMGLILNLLLPLYSGATSVLMSPSGFMHRPLGWLRSISRFRAEAATAPNFAYDLCVDRFRPEHMEGIDPRCWRLAINAAEPLRAATLKRFAACFQPYGFRPESMHPAYGLAEATLMVSSSAAGEGAALRSMSADALRAREIAPPSSEEDVAPMVCCGPALDGLEIAIVDPDTRRRLPSTKAGEIWVRGASVAEGYWGRSADSEQVFRASIAGETGAAESWLRTGDLGYLDGERRLFVVGRLKDVLIIRGVNHYHQDIEATAAEAHPALRRDHGAVFSVADGAGARGSCWSRRSNARSGAGWTVTR